MADRKISELPVATGASLADTDLFVIVDTSADENKSITKAELVAGFGAVMENDAQLSAIAQSKGITAVAGVVYNTAFDTDGGAWIDGAKARASSWYNETLNTSTRGSTRGFPAVAVILAEAYKVTIYDGTDPALPMWMVFQSVNGAAPHLWRNNRPVTCVSMRQAQLLIGISSGSDDSSGGLIVSNFASDISVRRSNSATVGSEPIINRNSGGVLSSLNDTGMISNIVNDVTMYCHPNAPIDPATGLQIPTIAVATAGGVSVINNNGTVTDSAVVTAATSCVFSSTGLYWTTDTAAYFATFADISAGDGFGDVFAFTFGGATGVKLGSRFKLLASGSEYVYLATNDLSQQANSLHVLQDMGKVSAETARVSITSTYNTGWMVGDIKAALLSSVSVTSLVNGGTDPDRSVNANPLTIYGTITRTAVATGAELVAYSGFSAANYLEQPYNSDLDFGTGDFSVMGWAKFTGTSGFFLERRDAAGSGNLIRIESQAGKPTFLVASSTALVSTIAVQNNGQWGMYVAYRKSGVLYFYFNGILQGSVACTVNVTNTSAVTLFGKAVVGGTPLSGSLSEWRISATAPTAAQIAKIYNDEKYLFRENALAVLSADAVTALAHDPVTDLLYVGGASGMATISGITPVSRDATAVTTFISVVDEMEVKQ